MNGEENYNPHDIDTLVEKQNKKFKENILFEDQEGSVSNDTEVKSWLLIFNYRARSHPKSPKALIVLKVMLRSPCLNHQKPKGAGPLELIK